MPFCYSKKNKKSKVVCKISAKYLVEQIKYCIFVTLESATLPIDQRTRAELFVYYTYEIYKPNLKDKGLAIEDEEKAIAILVHVSY